MENSESTTDGRYAYGGIDSTTFVFCEKIKKCFSTAVNIAVEAKKENPGIYILVNVIKNSVYIGQTNDVRERVGNQHWTNKDFTHIIALFDDMFSNINIRRNLEDHLVKFAKAREWNPSNSATELPKIDKRDRRPYNALEEKIDVIVNKTYGLVVESQILTKKETQKYKKKEHRASKQKWSVALAKADPEVRARIIKLTKMIQNRFNVTTVEKSWLYFDDGGKSSKHTFAALSIGKSVADLIFLAPHDSVLPGGARRLEGFVLAYNAECRLRLSEENLDLLVELAGKSREYRRTLESQG